MHIQIDREEVATSRIVRRIRAEDGTVEDEQVADFNADGIARVREKFGEMLIDENDHIQPVEDETTSEES